MTGDIAPEEASLTLFGLVLEAVRITAAGRIESGLIVGEPNSLKETLFFMLYQDVYTISTVDVGARIIARDKTLREALEFARGWERQ